GEEARSRSISWAPDLRRGETDLEEPVLADLQDEGVLVDRAVLRDLLAVDLDSALEDQPASLAERASAHLGDQPAQRHPGDFLLVSRGEDRLLLLRERALEVARRR